MRKVFLTTILALMSTMGVWATIHSGVTIDHSYMNTHFGQGSQYVPYTDSLTFNCNLVNDGDYDITYFYDTKLNKDLTVFPTSVGGYMNDPDYVVYKALNPDAATTDYFVMTGFDAQINGQRGKWKYNFEGHFTGFYSMGEMADSLVALNNSMTYPLDDATITNYVNTLMQTSASSAREIFEEYCQNIRNHDAEQKRLLAEAKEAAIAEIDTELGDIQDATLLATVQGYKNQINAATVIEAIAPIKANALAAIAAYKAEQERQRHLAEAKEAAIAAIQALVSGSTDELVISTANKYIALIEAATVINDVTRLRSEAESVITSLLTEPNGLTFGFIGTGNPIETQHALEGVKMTYSEDGEDMTVTINGADVTYPLDHVSELNYFRGTPTVSLTPRENPADPGYYYTTFYSGLEAYAIPEGVKAFTAELTSEGDALIVTQITSGVLPQDEGVLLESTSADAITLEATDPATGNKAANNSFEGSDVQIEIARPAGSIYVISAANSVMAFYKYTGSVIPANKAYIHIPAGQQAPARIIWNAHGSSTGGGITTDLNSTASAEPVEKFIQNGTLYIRKGEHVYNVQGVIVK